MLDVLDGLLNGHFDSVCWKFGTVLYVLDALFESVGCELGTRGVFDGLLDGRFDSGWLGARNGALCFRWTVGRVF